MDQSQSALLFGGRYELVSDGEHGSVEVIDREPWRRCWSCGSTENEAGEFFCTYCGADLRDRRYRGILTPASGGIALIATITDQSAREILPSIWDQVEEGERTLVILNQSDAASPTLPLDSLMALRVGLGFAHLLAVLHAYDLELGPLVPSDLGLTPDGQAKIVRIDSENVRPMSHDTRPDAVRDDLRALAGLLESLTNTPRMTQRFHDEPPALPISPPQDDEPDLAKVLREIRTGVIADAHTLHQHLDRLVTELTCPTALQQSFGAVTDTGIVRDHNEDSLLVMKLCMNNTSLERTWGLYIVADGMGGHAAGEIASGLAIRGASEIIMEEYLSFALDPQATYDENWVRDIVRRAVLQGNEAVRQQGIKVGNDMGTTITMALVVGDRVVVANVGDSRTYIYREKKLRRISKDHSLVMRLVELGQIREEDIYTHPQRNAVLRSLGDRAAIDVDIFTERLYSGDALLLCSDGQWEMTHDAEMEHILATYDTPEQTCQELIKAANHAGGEDNVTTILVCFT